MKRFRKRNLVENTEKKVVSLKILIKITFLVKIFWSQFCFVRSYNFFFHKNSTILAEAIIYMSYKFSM